MTGIVVLLWLGALYKGYVTMVKRAMHSQPKIDSSQSIRNRRQQNEKAEEIRERTKRLNEDRKSRLRDLQNQRLLQSPQDIRQRQERLMQDLRTKTRDLQRR